MTGQLAPDSFAAALVWRPARVMQVLLQQPARARAYCSMPLAASPKRRRQVQRDWWPEDAQPVRPKREKPQSLGLEDLNDLEASYKFEMELRHLPVVNEIPDRDDCRGGPRPCPLVSCPANLYLSRTRSGAAQLTFPNREPWDMPKDESCYLDIAERGPATVKTVARVQNMTEERVRQIQVETYRKLRNTRLGREWLRAHRGG